MQENLDQKKYIKLANKTIGICHKKILEIGGCTMPDLFLEYAPSAWICINLDKEAVSGFERRTKELAINNCSAYLQDIAIFNEKDAYDLLYSINCFEHVNKLDVAFEKMFQSLKWGGYLFTVFGPIWSSDVGHHLSIPSDYGELIFSDNILSPWEHLISTPEAIKIRLEKIYNEKTAETAVEYIFSYHDLNRLYEHEYMSIVKNSGFSPVIIYRKKRGKPPMVSGATNTREFLMILKKGHVSQLERLLFLFKLGLAYFSYNFQ